MVLTIDVDNTLNNLQEVVIKLFNQRHGTKYTLEDFTEYGVENCLPKDHAMKMQAMYGEPGLYNHVKPLPVAQKSLQKLINNGHSVYLVTDAIADTYGEKVAWIKRYFNFIDDAHIICMKHKWLIRCDMMIEDKYDTLIEKPYCHRVCVDYPWNKSTKDYVYSIYRCSNWNEILDVVNKISNEE